MHPRFDTSSTALIGEIDFCLPFIPSSGMATRRSTGQGGAGNETTHPLVDSVLKRDPSTTYFPTYAFAGIRERPDSPSHGP